MKLGRVVLAVLLLVAAEATAQSLPATCTPLLQSIASSAAQMTVTTTAQTLSAGGVTINKNAACLYIEVDATNNAQPVRYWDDGTTPTATSGRVLKAGTGLWVGAGQMGRVSFIRDTAATGNATLNISQYTRTQ